MKRFLFPRSGSERVNFARPSLFWAIAGTGSALVATAVASLVSVPNTAEAVLRRSDRCSEVVSLQTKLSDKGYRVGPLDGIFGSQTEEAVRRFQQDREDLAITGEGSEATLSALDLSQDLECSGVSRVATHRISTRFGSPLNLRREPNGAILAELSDRTPVVVVENRGSWSRLQRGGWVFNRYLQATGNITTPVAQVPPISNPTAGAIGGGGGNNLYIPPSDGNSGIIDVSNNGLNQSGGGGSSNPSNVAVDPSCPHTGTVTARGSLNVRNAPAGEYVRRAEEGSALCLTGDGEAKQRRFWAKLSDDNWVASEFIRLLN